jgi:hypothetical protein
LFEEAKDHLKKRYKRELAETYREVTDRTPVEKHEHGKE